VINSCHTACETTYNSCFDGCNGDPGCEANCLATKNTCDSNCAATDYAGNIHNFLWGGSLYEPETNLYWMRNRYYHKDMHRFINQDPIGIWGDANNLGNGFAYVAGMVIEASDPTGLQGTPSWLTDYVYRKVYKDNISAGKSEIVAKTNAEFAQLGVSLYCSPTDNVFDTADTIKSVLDLLDDLNGQSVPESQEPKDDWVKTGNTGKQTIYIYEGNTQVGSYTLTWVEYKNTKTGATQYVWSDGTVVTVAADGVTTTCTGPSCKALGYTKRPADPDSIDSIQTFFMNQFLKKMLEVKDKKRFAEIMEEEGPFTEYIDENGKKVFLRNPYYYGKDPMKELMWEIENADGTRGFVRNPFAPGADTSKQQELRRLIESGGVIGPSIFR